MYDYDTHSKPKMTKEESDKMMKKFLEKGGKVEKCQPGDVLLFDRRCDYCASGFVAAMACYVGKAILCEEDDGTRSVERGKYEHCGE